MQVSRPATSIVLSCRISPAKMRTMVRNVYSFYRAFGMSGVCPALLKVASSRLRGPTGAALHSAKLCILLSGPFFPLKYYAVAAKRTQYPSGTARGTFQRSYQRMRILSYYRSIFHCWNNEALKPIPLVKKNEERILGRGLKT